MTPTMVRVAQTFLPKWLLVTPTSGFLSPQQRVSVVMQVQESDDQEPGTGWDDSGGSVSQFDVLIEAREELDVERGVLGRVRVRTLPASELCPTINLLMCAQVTVCVLLSSMKGCPNAFHTHNIYHHYHYYCSFRQEYTVSVDIQRVSPKSRQEWIAV